MRPSLKTRATTIWARESVQQLKALFTLDGDWVWLRLLNGSLQWPVMAVPGHATPSSDLRHQACTWCIDTLAGEVESSRKDPIVNPGLLTYSVIYSEHRLHCQFPKCDSTHQLEQNGLEKGQDNSLLPLTTCCHMAFSVSLPHLVVFKTENENANWPQHWSLSGTSWL